MRQRTKSLFQWHIRALFLLCPLVASTPVGAQNIAMAEALFNSGLADMKAGRYETGCKALAESQRLDSRIGTLFTLATCEAQWGHIATAVTRYGDYLTLYDRLPEDRKASQADRYKKATETRAQLLPEVPQLTLSLPKGAPAETVVKLDGELVAEAALGVALPVDPGEHTLSTQVPGGTAQEQQITIGKREKKLVTLTVEAKTSLAVQPPPVPPAVTGSAPSRSYVGPILAFGAGAMGLGIGIGLGAAVLGKRAELDNACPSKNCPVSEQGNLESAKALSHVSTAGFILAGVGAATGTALLLLPAARADRLKNISVQAGVGHLRIEGTF